MRKLLKALGKILLGICIVVVLFYLLVFVTAWF